MFFSILRLYLAILLLATAMMKHLDAALILASGGLLASPLRLSLVVAFEVMAAVTIALAPARIAHAFSLLVFSLFACISAWAWWTQTDCGCFGMAMPQSMPLLVDAIAIALLIGCRQQAKSNEPPAALAFRRNLPRTLCAAGIAALLAAATTNWRVARIGDHTEMPAWFGENLIGRRFPLFHHERFSTPFAESGDAMVVMLRPDCERCVEIAGQWPAISANLRDDLRIIGISITKGNWAVLSNQVAISRTVAEQGLSLTWSNGNEPFVATPVFIAIRNGVVAGVANDQDASKLVSQADWVETLFGYIQ